MSTIFSLFLVKNKENLCLKNIGSPADVFGEREERGSKILFSDLNLEMIYNQTRDFILSFFSFFEKAL